MISGREDAGVVYGWLWIICRHHPKGTVAALERILGTALKDSGDVKPSQWAQAWALHLVVYFAWKYPLLWAPQASESTRQIGEFPVRTEVAEPDYYGEIGLHNGGQVLVSISLYPEIKVNGKLLIQQPNQGRTTNGLETSGMKVWVLPAGEEPQPAEMLLKEKGVQNG